MAKRTPYILIGCTIAAGVMIITSMFVIVGPRLSGSSVKTVECTHTGTKHFANIQDSKILPAHTYAKTCDTLTVVNKDNKNRLMAFGLHERHISYDGKDETELQLGQEFTITLNKTGTYIFHDHHDDAVFADFTVTR